MTVIGYCRVSTDKQDNSLAAQRERLKAEGAERIFSESASGALSDRPQLRKAMATLEHGDLFVVTALDRLSRSLHDLVVTLKAIADNGAKFRSLREPWASTDSPSGRFMIAILGGMAEFERELIRSRMAEGISRKRARGEHLGPDFKLSPEAQKAIVRRYEDGEPMALLADEYGVGRATVYRALDRARAATS
jgi:DNA invertase Pin-like site-specific DNA recombinase